MFRHCHCHLPHSASSSFSFSSPFPANLYTVVRQHVLEPARLQSSALEYTLLFLDGPLQCGPPVLHLKQRFYSRHDIV